MTVREFIDTPKVITSEYIYWYYSLTVEQKYWLNRLCLKNPDVLDKDMDSIDFREAYNEDS